MTAKDTNPTVPDTVVHSPRSRRPVPRRAAATLGVAALCASSVALGAAPANAADEATVSVMHGIPGLTVDVYANGQQLLPDFAPGTLTEPQKLPAGAYDIQVFKDNEGPGGTPALQKNVDVPAGANATIVAHLGADGTPMLTTYVNDTAPVAAGKARVTVRHVAAAPAVDVRANGTPVFTGLTNPKEAKGDVDAGMIKADVTLAGTSTVALGPADLNLAEGTNTIVYAYGSANDKTLALKTQTITGLHSAPAGVPAGESGAAANAGGGSGSDTTGWVIGAASVAAIGLAAGGYRVVSKRR
ncbi:DUF4397 domain-containing protein [Yinghuangia sp. YIM S10712]|uniref:DUF4397 domain-containing protein n=1 Tax=Yinghuangia sp. YIM S10712 TaxID=3436930 RepID=UPI003F53AF80